MRILEINKFFYPRGGAEVVFFDTINGLKNNGHEVAEFSMRHQNNLPSAYKQYFICELPELLGPTSPAQKLKLFGHLFYSPEVVHKLKSLIYDTLPEVAHLHNVYHHLSSSLFTTLRKQRVPIVLTLHDVFPLVPNHSFMRGDKLDEEAYFGKPYNCLRYRCIDNEFLPSLAGTLENYYFKWRGIWDMVDAFICPSAFMRDIMVRAGFPHKKLHVIYNPVNLPQKTTPPGNAVLYLGRLHVEKGIKIFMEAVRILPANTPVVIAGTGPLDYWVKNFVSEYKLTNVKIVGFADKLKQQELMDQAGVVVVPSVFYENCSLSILEAQAAGRLVVASNRGGNPELVIPNESGWLFEPENPASLAEAIVLAMGVDKKTAAEYTENARNRLIKQHSTDGYLKQVEDLFSKVVLSKKKTL